MIEAHLVSCLHCVRRAEENLRSIREKGRAHLVYISNYHLERYHLGYMTDALTITGIEQHISECRDCADRMLATERFIYVDEPVRSGKIPCPRLPVGDSMHHNNRSPFGCTAAGKRAGLTIRNRRTEKSCPLLTSEISIGDLARRLTRRLFVDIQDGNSLVHYRRQQSAVRRDSQAVDFAPHSVKSAVRSAPGIEHPIEQSNRKISQWPGVAVRRKCDRRNDPSLSGQRSTDLPPIRHIP